MTSSKNNGFTASDIERYHSGKMSQQERNALEKAALDDPFLADALEGYAFAATPVDDLAKIHSRLDQKLNRKKVVPIFQKYKWIGVAAIVLIIAGGGWLVYSISESGKSADMAVQLEKDSNANSNYALPDQTIATDSISASGNVTNEQPTVTNTAKTKLESTKDNNFASTPQQKLNREQETADNKKETVHEITAPPAVQNQAASNNSLANVEQKNAAKNNISSPSPQANVRLEQAQARAPVFKDMPNAKTAAAGRVNNVKANDSITNMNVVLEPLPADSLSLQEVVVGYGTQKRSAQKYPRVIIDTLEPAEGYVKFDDYIAGNLKTPVELKMKSLSGEVQLSFDVDKTGQPVNITVEKSLCASCDQEAIRLLKEGPKWKKKKNKKGKVTIKF